MYDRRHPPQRPCSRPVPHHGSPHNVVVNAVGEVLSLFVFRYASSYLADNVLLLYPLCTTQRWRARKEKNRRRYATPSHKTQSPHKLISTLVTPNRNHPMQANQNNEQKDHRNTKNSILHTLIRFKWDNFPRKNTTTSVWAKCTDHF